MKDEVVEEGPSCLSEGDLDMLVKMAHEKRRKLEIELIQERDFQQRFGLAMNRDSSDVEAELAAFDDMADFEARLRAIPRCR